MYTVKIVDNVTKCEGLNSAPLTITVNALPTAAPTATLTPICKGASTTLVATGCSVGTPVWYNDAALTMVISAPVSPMATRDYWVRCESNGCFGPVAQISQTVNQAPVCLITTDNTICLSDTNTASTAETGKQYLWTVSASGQIVGSNTNQNVQIKPLTSGTYTVKLVITDPITGCKDSCTSEVLVYGLPTEPIVSTTYANCGVGGSASILNFNNTLTYTVMTGSVTPTGVIQGANLGLNNYVIATDVNGCSSDTTPFILNVQCIQIEKATTTVAITMVGQVVDYSYTVTNTGSVPLSSITVTDNGPTFGGILGTNPLQGVNCPSTVLLSDSSMVCTAQYIVSQTDLDNALASNSLSKNVASVAGFPPVGPPSIDVSDTVQIPVTPNFALELQKTASAATVINGSNSTTVDAGDIITYTYVVTNTGNATLANVAPVDNGPTFSGIAGTNAFSPFNPTSTPSLAPGASFTFTATYTLSQTDINNSALSMGMSRNIATAKGTPPGSPEILSPPDTAMVVIPNMPMIGIEKTASPATIILGSNGTTVDAGDQITYTFTVTNTGNISLNNVSVTDPGPSFGGIPGTGTLSTFNPALILNLQPGVSVTVTAIYTLSQDDINNAK
jgi:uncharacterized repeat protein (TIGR01451 family)